MVVDVMNNHENLLSYFLDGNVATFGGDILLCLFFTARSGEII